MSFVHIYFNANWKILICNHACVLYVRYAVCIICSTCTIVWDPQRCRTSVFCLGVRWQSPCESDPESWGTKEGSSDKTTSEEKDRDEQPTIMMQCDKTSLASSSFSSVLPYIMPFIVNPPTHILMCFWTLCLWHLQMQNKYLVFHELRTCRWIAGCKRHDNVAPGIRSWKLGYWKLWSRCRHTGRGCWQSTQVNFLSNRSKVFCFC